MYVKLLRSNLPITKQWKATDYYYNTGQAGLLENIINRLISGCVVYHLPNFLKSIFSNPDLTDSTALPEKKLAINNNNDVVV